MSIEDLIGESTKTVTVKGVDIVLKRPTYKEVASLQNEIGRKANKLGKDEDLDPNTWAEVQYSAAALCIQDEDIIANLDAILVNTGGLSSPIARESMILCGLTSREEEKDEDDIPT